MLLLVLLILRLLRHWGFAKLLILANPKKFAKKINLEIGWGYEKCKKSVRTGFLWEFRENYENRHFLSFSTQNLDFSEKTIFWARTSKVQKKKFFFENCRYRGFGRSQPFQIAQDLNLWAFGFILTQKSSQNIHFWKSYRPATVAHPVPSAQGAISEVGPKSSKSSTERSRNLTEIRFSPFGAKSYLVTGKIQDSSKNSIFDHFLTFWKFTPNFGPVSEACWGRSLR